VAAAPLDGVVVLDLGRIVAAPLCTFLLASLGATVIRIDQPGGDVSWKSPPFVGPDGAVNQGPRQDDAISLAHLRRDRGKRSIVLDLETAEGRALLGRLAGRADVLVQNYRPSTLARLGLDYEALAAVNPRLIYCAISGYGLTGPYRDRMAMDIAIQAASGFLARTGFPDGPPIKAGPIVGDQVPAVYAAFGILAALRQREYTGRGQLVDVGMFDVVASLVWDEPIELYDEAGLGVRWGNSDPRGGPLNVYRTTDGWVALVVGSDTHWQHICALMDRPDLATYGATLADRTGHLDELDQVVAAWCATQDSATLAHALGEAGIPSSPVVDPIALRDDPHVAARGTLVDLVHPATPDRPSGYLGASLPLRLSAFTPAPAPAETLGASTDQVLAELLGLTPAELDGLRARGVI
jgi:crotonobetainyl-CoA:carnitine CoA-transferase CaiB-like acyl-CoA transferase